MDIEQEIKIKIFDILERQTTIDNEKQKLEHDKRILLEELERVRKKDKV